VRIEEVRAFPVVVSSAANEHAGGAGVVGERSGSGRYARMPPHRPLYARDAETVLVRVRADDGTVGWGESQAPVGGTAVAALVDELLAPLLQGRDPRDREVLQREMVDSMRDRGHGGGFMLDAIAGVDNAIWDLCGKHWGEPVARLLGGAFAASVPLYLSGPRGGTLEERLDDAQSFVEQGFRAVKLFGGRGVREDLAEAARFRERLGEEVELLVDAQWLYARPDALRLGRGLEELGVALFEAPTNPEDVEGHAELARALDVPVGLGETERSRWQVLPFLRAGAVDVLQPDVGRCGVTEAHRIGLLADLFNVPVALHCGIGFGPYIAASLHVAAALPNVRWVEYQPEMHRIAREAYGAEFQVEDGRLVLPDRPGLGLDGPPEALLGPL
jgi:galactonate dehydratase